MQRLRIEVRGAVQGVGFRPYIYRLAEEMGLAGWVNNNAQGVQIEVEGDKAQLDAFLLRLEPEKPQQAFIQSLEPAFLDPVHYASFEILASESGGPKSALVLPDLATCPDCLRELFDSDNRRYRYPFINCTNCGPRFSIMEALPYDRPNTAMRGFPLCDACREEYENPRDRRFHAQPNACPVCGPRLEFRNAQGDALSEREDALRHAVRAIRDGEIVAIKGIGGFLLMTDARDEDAVRRLRARKHREEKPFALMYPTLHEIRRSCEMSDLEERLLCSTEAPIVLLRRRPEDGIAPSVAPGSPDLGVMLPYSPLHHLLMAELGFPVVATSGNRSDEPICIDNDEATERLHGIADAFLLHDRPIVRHVDDSIARVLLGHEMLLRRARGYAPLPITLDQPLPPLLAVGAHLKNTVAVSQGRQVFLSQHIGDLETAEAYGAFQNVIADLTRLFEIEPEAVVCDKHPDYLSTRFAERSGLPVQRVQHHVAHVYSCMAENGLQGPLLGVSWDGTGYGDDGVIWGSEFFHVEGSDYRRAAHLRTFRLPGGDLATKEPRRTAIGLLYEVFGDAAFARDDLAPVRLTPKREMDAIRVQLGRGLNAPLTTSMGRLFDGVAALLNVRQSVRYEGQAAIELEALAHSCDTDDAYRIGVVAGTLQDADAADPPPSPSEERAGRRGAGGEVFPPLSHEAADGPWESECSSPFPARNERTREGGPRGLGLLDWEPLIRAIIEDLANGVSANVISARFHNALAEAIVIVAKTVGKERVVLTGGCFLNRRLLERSVQRLEAEGFRPYRHQRVPPGDGGIALGQIAFAAATRSAIKE